MGLQKSSLSEPRRRDLPELLPASDAHDQRRKTTSQSDQGNALQQTLSHLYPKRLRTAELSIHTQARYGDLYPEFLRARKRVFIDQKGWNLPNVDGMEFDQYDTPQSVSIAIHDFGQVLAGIRLLPTTAKCGCYSYMLRDAQRGLLTDIPAHVLYESAPVADHVWEATRLFVSSDVPAERRSVVQAQLMIEMASIAVRHGASHVIGIVPAVFRRWMGRLGLSALPLGPQLVIDGDKTQAAVMHVAKFAQ
ncbi:Isovaleryl-homoserine lactone synthase [Roseivivax sp. THAF40]|uniref:acyl-homoserine-lactone synthase n=1 Tax=unclassified Roseivivax TaxID=2639302 RepID=UPI001267DEE7|nr:MULTISPECIES: acyl-homoserine-lactone synthase [unclassified Roseivivax]QFS83759.1 Isovaleryl-homoserine lactone synthase [Roseivivax sp. THAF197b]QFT47561.1 Isovaleryl-homoserine lactone synthase [Roseivivax sp. THAF40]